MENEDFEDWKSKSNLPERFRKFRLFEKQSASLWEEEHYDTMEIVFSLTTMLMAVCQQRDLTDKGFDRLLDALKISYRDLLKVYEDGK